MTIIGFYDDIFLKHKQKRHPERPERLQAIHRLLPDTSLMEQIEWRAVQPVQPEQVFAVHDEPLWASIIFSRSYRPLIPSA